MTDMTFDPTQHPRIDDGTFTRKPDHLPEVGLDTRASRLARAAELEAQKRAIVRSGRNYDRGEVEKLDTQLRSLYAREDRQAEPVESTKLASTNRTLDHYLDHGAEKFDLNPPYQRGSVWTLEQRQALIKSMLRQIPIGSVLVNDRWAVNDYQGEFGYAIVDGKQRIETLRGFVADEFAVPADWFEDKHIVETNDDGTLVYSQLSEVAHRMIGNWPVPTLEAQEPTIEAEAELFLLINGGGTAQAPEDMARAQSVARG